jgi:flagellin
MTSIITNNSAMNALSIMRNVNNDLTETQNRISTGLKIRSGKDNAAYFAISETMKGDSAAFKSIDEGLTLTKNVVSTGRLGAETIADLASQFVDRVSFAQGEGVDREKVQAEMDALVERMQTALDQSTFNGASMVDGDAERQKIKDGVTGLAGTTDFANYDAAAATNNSLSIVTGVSRDSSGTFGTTSITIKKVDLKSVVEQLGAIDVTDAAADLPQLLNVAADELSRSIDAATELGIAEKSIETQQEFLGELTNRLDAGIGSMIDANMEEEAAKLQAVQLQQQLATQSLSIANQGPSNLMSLFR